MAQLGQTFRSEDAPEDTFELVPARTQALMQVIGSDVVSTKDGRGTILKLQVEIMSGPYERRQIWENLNISNPNATAQGIAQRALANLLTAVGLSVIDNTEELHFKPFLGTVGVREDKSGQYRPQNSIAKYQPANGTPIGSKAPPLAGGSQPPAAPPPRPQTPPPPRPAGNRPWGQRPGA